MGVVVLLTTIGDTEARLRPYYVLRSAVGDNNVTPRILFVLDTSGSMGNKSQPGQVECLWEECEDPALEGTQDEGRMSVARRIIRGVVTATGDNGNFGLMTFDQNDPHRSNRFPDMCEVGGIDQRFLWVTDFYYSNPTQNITRDGHTGVWRLCQGRQIRPYSYLRWDDLGVGSVITSNNEVGPVPPSPLVSKAWGDVSDTSNAFRRVQWFPRFMGVRFQPNDTTDPGKLITYETTGDYAMTDTERDAEVWEHDFYYWPYVDGFPGYANYRLEPYHPSGTNPNLGGIAASQSPVKNAGKLFAPFYLNLDGTGVPVDPIDTPEDREDGLNRVLTNTSPIIEGGVDAAGVTPWANTVGEIPLVPTQSNAAFAHETIAGYLSFVNEVETPDICAPTAAVLITDGNPHPSNQGGALLYERLAALRTELNVDVYVIGFFLFSSSQLNNMACAGAGACDGAGCDTPCDDSPADAWDTCADPADNANNCAFVADSADALEEALNQIISRIGEFDIPSGPGSATNEFDVGNSAGGDPIAALQTSVTATTEFPAWRGHVMRGMCDHLDVNDEDEDGDTDELAPACQPAAFPDEEVEEAFGPCPQQRVWDAGECLSQTPWADRRLYTNTAANEVIPVSNPDGTASGQFHDELVATNAITGPDTNEQADEIAAFLLGANAPDNWRLPGLASSAPIVVRRMPPYNPGAIPSVAIRDPHCGGRSLGAADGVPATLEEYAAEVWDEDNLLPLPSPHYEAQEAVLIGDDFGVLHAFQFNSGNELWGFIPRYLLPSLAEKAAVGAASYGQEGELENHNYGLSATINRGWVYDDTAADPTEHRWRQLAIMGMGPGGTEHMVIDVSHMSPFSPRGPLEILWTTEDASLKADYDLYNGETWARPALGYHIPGDTSVQTPEAYFVMGTGYSSGGGANEGRTLLQVDALTGEIVDFAVLPAVDPDDVYEANFGTVVDPAVGTHCLSRLWAEMQEVYVADPAGRLFRWDLGRETDHEADSNAVWGNAAQMALDSVIPACVGNGATCDVDENNPAESFSFAPAVTSSDRLDDIATPGAATTLSPSNQFLIGMIGGSPADDALDDDDVNRYHSSIYIMVDDHSSVPSEGFSVPVNAPKAAPGDNASYMRLALSDIERTRSIIPYEGAGVQNFPGTFNQGTRPIRAPRIFVTGVVDQATVDNPDGPDIIDGVEVYYLEFTVYEPPAVVCDSTFYDAATDTWHEDPGSTYVLTFRLTADIASGFDLINGAGNGGGGPDSPASFDPGYETGLTLESVSQVGTGDCANGGCGAQLTNPAPNPCNNGTGEGRSTGTSTSALTISHSELAGFTPIE